jgi:hypothetical protein
MKAITSALTRSSSAAQVAWMAIYDLPTAAPTPKAADFDGVEGLTVWHVHQPAAAGAAASTRLVTYWMSQGHFARDAPLLQRKLGISPVVAGAVGATGSAPLQWWQKVKPTTVVLSLAALLGAVEVIVNRYEKLLLAPDLAIKFDLNKVNGIEDTELGTPITVHNELTIDHTNITLDAHLVNAEGKKLPLQLSEQRLALLSKSEAQVVSVLTAAPQAGKYTLHVSAESKAGWARFRDSAQTTTTLVVWPKVPTSTVVLKSSGSNRGALTGTIRLGHKALNGLNCEWQIEGMPGLAFEGLFDMAVRHSRPVWSTYGVGAASVALMRWDLGAVTSPMSALDVELVLLGPPGTDWSQVAQKSRLVCRYSKEMFNG